MAIQVTLGGPAAAPWLTINVQGGWRLLTILLSGTYTISLLPENLTPRHIYNQQYVLSHQH